MTQFHRAIVSPIHDMDASTVHADKGQEDGVQIQYGCRYGSQTREAFAYIFDPEKFSAAEAMAYMEGKGISIVEFRPAVAKIELAKKDDYVEVEYEAAKVGTWKPHVYDAQGNEIETEVEFTTEMFRQMVETFEAGKAPNKLTHAVDQSMAREMFENSDAPMGHIHALKVDGDALVAVARVPRSVADAIKIGLLVQRSIEATKRAGKWVLDAVAWLKNTPPAVQGMADARVAANIFAAARIVLADAAPSPGGPVQKSGENKPTAGTGPEGAQNPDPEEGKENDMSDELKAQVEQMLKSYRASASRQIDDLVGRKITPAQGEAAKKLIATMTSTESIDAQIEFLRASQDLPEQKQVGNGKSPKDDPSALDAAAEREKKIAASERSAAHRMELGDNEARLMAAAKQYMANNPAADFGDALMAVSRHMPQDHDAYIAATGRGEGGQ